MSDVDVEKISSQLQQFKDKATKQAKGLSSQVADKLPGQSFNTIKADVENYLLNSQPWHLNRETIKQEFNDPQEGWKSISDRLSQFDRDTLVSLLSQREDISEEEANRIADQVESVRNQFVEQAQLVQHRMQSVIDGVFGKIRNYLNSLDRPELNYEGIKRDFRKVFDDPEVGFEALRDHLSHFDRETLVAVMSSREDISEADANRIIDKSKGCAIAFE